MPTDRPSVTWGQKCLCVRILLKGVAEMPPAAQDLLGLHSAAGTPPPPPKSPDCRSRFPGPPPPPATGCTLAGDRRWMSSSFPRAQCLGLLHHMCLPGSRDPGTCRQPRVPESSASSSAAGRPLPDPLNSNALSFPDRHLVPGLCCRLRPCFLLPLTPISYKSHSLWGRW